MIVGERSLDRGRLHALAAEDQDRVVAGDRAGHAVEPGAVDAFGERRSGAGRGSDDQPRIARDERKRELVEQVAQQRQRSVGSGAGHHVPGAVRVVHAREAELLDVTADRGLGGLDAHGREPFADLVLAPEAFARDKAEDRPLPLDFDAVRTAHDDTSPAGGEHRRDRRVQVAECRASMPRTAATHGGCEWPIMVAPRAPAKSRYSPLPVTPHAAPAPRTSVSGPAYVPITWGPFMRTAPSPAPATALRRIPGDHRADALGREQLEHQRVLDPAVHEVHPADPGGQGGDSALELRDHATGDHAGMREELHGLRGRELAQQVAGRPDHPRHIVDEHELRRRRARSRAGSPPRRRSRCRPARWSRRPR